LSESGEEQDREEEERGSKRERILGRGRWAAIAQFERLGVERVETLFILVYVSGEVTSDAT